MSHLIKGGGRVSLSESTEVALIDCLMRRRNCWPTNATDHDLKCERKRFVKRLVESYEKQKAHQQINSSPPPPPSSKSCEPGTPGAAITTIGRSTDAATGVSGKVRVELVEAIYTKDSLTVGKKKVLVFPRSTSVSDVLKQAQSKLRIKKPVRVFILAGTSKQEVNLETNLAAISDGAILYVSSTPSAPAASNHDNTDPLLNAIKNDEDQVEEDPLEEVKKVYAKQEQREYRRALAPVCLPVPHPKFSNHFQSLPPLTERAGGLLPAAHCRLDFLQAVQDHRVVIISGSTGCGKSTQLPQFLWQAMQASQSDHCHVIVTQPRRVAATALAQRVSQEMNSPLPGRPGSLVGHHIRLDRAVADTAQIVYCTVGILLRELVGSQANTSLSDVTHVVVDEVHERDVQTDFLLTLLRAILTRNTHLRLILMSATASITLFENYFAPYKPFVLTIPGTAFPVETKWLAECERLTSRQLKHYQDGGHTEKDSKTNMDVALSPQATDIIDNTFILSLIDWIIRQQQSKGQLSSRTQEKRTNGAILVFLPGKAEIEALFRVLIRFENYSLPTDAIRIHKLHSGTVRSVQKSIFEPTPSNTVKIILSTNIAETSITIPDISHVIDTGRVKESRYSPTMRMKELVTVWTSQASANQRAGRAGRTNAGVCYKLYSEQLCNNHFLAQTPPEMVRTPLDELILQLCLLYEQRRDNEQKQNNGNFPKGANPLHFLSQVPEPSPTASIKQACQHLLDVDALHMVETKPFHLFRLTPLGFHLSRLPMDAKVGKTLIVGCILGCLDGALTIAATLSCSRSCFFNKPLTKSIVNREEDKARQSRARMIENGFGGKEWKGGTVKGDLIAAIACYREWARCSKKSNERYKFACQNSLDHGAMQEIDDLRQQYLSILVDTGFVSTSSSGIEKAPQNEHRDDALLTSCCLVAGLYPNVCTLMRPRMGGPKGGRLLTKEGDICRPQLQSFQRHRVDKAAQTGKDTYAMYHSKHRCVDAGKQSGGDVVLNEVNFVSRYALLLFGGELEIEKNALILDNWLKFKVGEKSLAGAVILLATRDELDAILLRQISFGNAQKAVGGSTGPQDHDHEAKELMTIIRQLLAEE